MRTISELVESFNIPQLRNTPHGYKGCCTINPAHNDSSPSMHIHVEKGHVKCFSCGAYTPLFQFLLDNGATFDEAIEFMFISHDRATNDTEGISEYYLGRYIPKSMLDRGFTKETLNHFEVGYDDYEDRTTIPLRYPFGGVLYGVQFRKFPKDFWATDGFNKDNFIYNFEATDTRVYVEGFTDTWRTWQNGSKNVSASLSANPSEGQLSIMAQHKEIWLAYDNDIAGFRGAFKVHEELKRNVDIYMIPYPGKDPGDCTKEQWEKAIASRTTFLEFEVALMTKNPDLYKTIKNPINYG